jgi:hypothetical protein
MACTIGYSIGAMFADLFACLPVDANWYDFSFFFAAVSLFLSVDTTDFLIGIRLFRFQLVLT